LFLQIYKNILKEAYIWGKKIKSKKMKRFEKHIFVCTNQREEGHPRGCCANKNGYLDLCELEYRACLSGTKQKELMQTAPTQ